jgi:ACR3 family arsenite efflux pump ArsB
MSISSTLQQLLRNKEAVLGRTLGEGLTAKELTALFTLCLGLLMGYGLLIGARYDALQAVVSAVKLPILFLLTTAICFPTLYMFLSYLGIRQGLKQLLGLMLLSLTYISLILAAFAPSLSFF